MFSAAAIISTIGGFFVTRPCAQIDWLLGQDFTLNLYPGCLPFYKGQNPDQQVVVKADMNSSDPIAIAAALGVSFGPAGCLAFWIHAVLIEVYLRLTPAESQRLRQVSYERQLERGFKHPGSAGLVAQRLGDANPYVPLSQRRTDKSGDELDMLATDGRKSVGDDESR